MKCHRHPLLFRNRPWKHSNRCINSRLLEGRAFSPWKGPVWQHAWGHRRLCPALRAQDHSSISVSDVEKLTYAQLQAALAGRRLSTLGKKHELIERLKNALQADQASGSASEAPDISVDSSLSEQDEAGVKAQIRQKLELLPYKQIVQQLSLRLLNASGRKAQLIERLADAMYSDLTGQEATRPAPAPSRAAPSTSASPAQATEPGELDAIISGLESEPYASIRVMLQQRGLSSAGRKEVLVQRLAEAMLAEQQQEKQQQQQAEAVRSTSRLILSLVERVIALSPDDWSDEVLAELDQYSDEQLDNVGQVLSGPNQAVAGSRPQLQATVANLLIDLVVDVSQGSSSTYESLQLMASSADDQLRAQAQEQTSAVPAISAKDIQGMELSALRAALRQQGLSDKGSKLELQERLEISLKEQPSLSAQLQQLLNVQLERMSLLELLNAALDQQWDVSDLSTCTVQVARSLMKDKCRRHMAELGADEDRLKWLLDFAVKRVQRRLLEPQEPATTVSVVFTSPAALLQHALDGVRHLVEALHTRPNLGMHSHSFAFPSYVPEPGSADASPQAREEILAAMQKGINVEVLFVAEDGQVFEFPLNYVLSAAPDSLLAERADKSTRSWPSLQAFGKQLKQSSSSVVLPVVFGAGSQPVSVLKALEGVGTPLVGAAAAVHDTVLRKDRLQAQLSSLGYPSLPTLTISQQQSADLDSLTTLVQDWVSQNGWTDPSRQVLVVKPASGSYSTGVQPVRGFEAAAQAVQALHSTLGGDDVVVELYWLREREDKKKAVEFSVSVIQAPGTGTPVALLPVEVELWDLERQIFDSDVDLLEWQLQQEGQTQELIQDDLREARSTAQLDAQLDILTPTRITLPNQQVKFHSPPRLSRKTIHHIRHAATKLFTQLGLQDFATFDGFVLLDPDWEKAYDPNPDDPYPTLPDPSPAILDILIEQEEERKAKEALPLESYFDSNTYKADLEGFDPAVRCLGPEAAIHFFDINTQLNPQPNSMLCLQAAEMGLAPANLFRNLLNSALSRAGRPTLPLDTPVQAAPSAVEMDVGLDDEVDGVERVYTRDYNWVADPEEYALVDQFMEVPPEAVGVEEMQDYSDRVEPEDWSSDSFTPPAEWRNYSQAEEEGTLMGDVVDDFDGPAQDDESIQDRLLSNRQASTSDAAGSSSSGAESGGQDATEPPWRDIRLAKSQTERGQAFHLDNFTDQYFFDVPGFKDSVLDWKLQPIDNLRSHPVAESTAELEDESDSDTDSTEWGEEQNTEYLSRRKVWLLVGGDDSQRHASVAAGVNVWSKLQRLKDLQVELFLVSPVAAGLNTVERRKNMLKKRVELKAWGFKEEDLPEAFQVPSIRYPMVSTPSVADRHVWLAPLPPFLRGNADEIAEHCERTYELSSVSEWSMPELHQQQLQSQVETQMELHTAGVQGVASLWDGTTDALPPAPLRMDLGRLMGMAKKHNAVVVNLLRGGVGADGRLQQLLHHADVSHAGSTWTTCEACWDKMDLQEQLVGMEENGVFVTPRVELTTDTLIAGSINVEDAVDLLQAVQVALDDATTIIIKPNQEAGGCGVAVLETPEDVVLYFEAYRQGWPILKANSLTLPHPAINLPPFMPISFVFEPYIPSDRITIKSSGGFAWGHEHGEEGSNPWVEVKMTIIGQLGSLKVLPPSMIAWTEDANGGRKVPITPVPSWCSTDEAILECMQRTALVAERLAIQGIAELDGFMHCETGELYVMEVNTQVDLSSSSPVFAQGVAGGSYPPVDLARQLVHLALAPPSLVEMAPAVPQAPVLDEDEELLEAIGLLGDEGEDAGGFEGEDGLDAADAFMDGLGVDDDDIYENNDILFKEGVGEQDIDLDDDESYDEEDSLFSFDQ